MIIAIALCVMSMIDAVVKTVRKKSWQDDNMGKWEMYTFPWWGSQSCLVETEPGVHYVEIVYLKIPNKRRNK